jgi:hypothetical protein
VPLSGAHAGTTPESSFVYSEWVFEWQEKLPTNAGVFNYTGVLRDSPGRSVIRGDFYWSVMPRKGGSFFFECRRAPGEGSSVEAGKAFAAHLDDAGIEDPWEDGMVEKMMQQQQQRLID